jgi:hypothetical protein
MKEGVYEAIVWTAEHLHEQKFGVAPFIFFPCCKLIGKEFVNGLQLLFYKMEKRVYPQNSCEGFQESYIPTVSLLNMKKFMAKHLLTIGRVQVDLIIPEQPPEKRKRRARFRRIDKIDISGSLNVILPQ